MTRPNRPGRLTHGNALRFQEPLLRLSTQAVVIGAFHADESIRARFGLSYWGSAVLTASRAMGCGAVYSEDMSSRQDYDDLRAIGPFAQRSGG